MPCDTKNQQLSKCSRHTVVLTRWFVWSHIKGKLVEEAGNIIIVSLAENYVEVKEKLVANTKSILTDLTGKAVEVVDVLTSPHHHFQRRYGFYTLRANSSGSKQSAINSIQEREHIIVQQNTGAT